jgi:drug/metabolite transporter (DMT)-like permease
LFLRPDFVGAQLWKLHYLREDDKNTQETDSGARHELYHSASRTAPSKSLQNGGGYERNGLGSEQRAPQNVDRPTEWGVAEDPSEIHAHTQALTDSDQANTGSDNRVIRHVRTHSNQSIASIASALSNGGISINTASQEPDEMQQLETEDIQCRKSIQNALPSCLWTAGFSVFLVGNVLDFIALGLTKVSIVTLVGSGSLVVNTVMARMLLKEIVTMLDILSAGCIIVGIALTVIGNQSEVKEWPVEELVKQYSRPDVVAMLVIFTGLIVACLLVMAIDTTRRRAVAARTGVAPKPSRWVGAITCIVGAFVATFTILFGKAFSNLILLSIAGDNQFTDAVTVLIVLAFMVCVARSARLCIPPVESQY